MLTPEKIQRIKSLNGDQINKKLMIELFSKKAQKDQSGKIVISPAYCKASDAFTLYPDDLITVKSQIETTVGLFIFNIFCIIDSFYDKIPYHNETLNDKQMDGLMQTIVNEIIKGKIDVKEFGKFQERVLWLGYLSELFTPGMSMKMKYPLPKVEKRKKELFTEYKDEIEKGNQVVVAERIEPELLELARGELKDEPGFELYAKGGKPKFENNYKNMQVVVGPIKNPTTGKYHISDASLTDGYTPEEQHHYAGSLIHASYSRAVVTQDGGAYVKFLAAALQSVQLDKEGSDCGTLLLKRVSITKSNKSLYLWKYFKEKQDGDLILMTDENVHQYIGKDVLMRQMIFCKGKKYCNKCAGNLYYSLGIKNLGLASIRVPSTFLNLSLKKMHDTTVKVESFKPQDYFILSP